MNMIQYSTADN